VSSHINLDLDDLTPTALKPNTPMVEDDDLPSDGELPEIPRKKGKK
jgi:hypothetical protein